MNQNKISSDRVRFMIGSYLSLNLLSGSAFALSASIVLQLYLIPVLILAALLKHSLLSAIFVRQQMPERKQRFKA